MSVRVAPSPPGSPWLGHALAFRHDPPNFLRTVAAECGPVTRLRLGPLTYHLVSDPTLVAEVLQSRAINYLRDTRSSRRVHLLTGESLLTTEGEEWRRQRHAAQPMFHQGKVLGLGRTMADVAFEVAARWRQFAASGEVVELGAEMSRLAFAMASRCLFGSDLAGRFEIVERVFPPLLEELFRRTAQLVTWPLWVPFPRHQAFKASLASIDKVVAALIDEHRNRPETQDLLGLLLQFRDEEGERLDDRALRNQVVTFLLAGHETTASALTWSLALIEGSRERGHSVSTELATLVGPDPRPFPLEVLPKLVHLGASVDETLRLYPSIWILERRVAEDDTLGGFSIPADSSVVLSPYVTQRNPDLWRDPDEFCPERFSLVNSRHTLASGYYPFGAGPHVCIGQHFALMEVKIALATLLAQFRVVRLQPGLPRVRGGITLRPDGPILIRIELRT